MPFLSNNHARAWIDRQVAGPLAARGHIAYEGQHLVFLDGKGRERARAVRARADGIEQFFLRMQAEEAGIFVSRRQAQLAQRSRAVIKLRQIYALALAIRARADIQVMNRRRSAVGESEQNGQKFHDFRTSVKGDTPLMVQKNRLPGQESPCPTERFSLLRKSVSCVSS
jgi:hypothetical protein